VKKIFSYITVSAVFLISACLLFISRPVKPASAQTPATLTVCASGTAGAGGCNYIGASGIQQAFNTVTDGGKVIIKSGVYNPVMAFINKNNVSIFGENATLVGGVDYDNILSILGNNITVEGFTFKISRTGITIGSLGNVTIRNNLFLYGSAPGTGSWHIGIHYFYNSTQQVNNNIVNIRNNTFYGLAGDGILVNSNSFGNTIIKNNIFSNMTKATFPPPNNNLTYGGYGITVYAYYTGIDINKIKSYHNLFWSLERGCNQLYYVTSSIITNNWCTTNGSKNAQNPLFLDPASGNFRLQTSSPAINAGDPGMFDPDGTKSDIGAHGGPEADIPPTGYFDGIDCNAGWGWGYDYDKGDQPILIDFWLEKGRPLNSDLPENVYLGGTLANINRPDLPYTNKNHGFTMYWKDIQAAARQYFYTDRGEKRTVSAFGINIDKNGKQQNYYLGSFMHTLLTQPRDSQCNQPFLSPTPTVTRTPTPTPFCQCDLWAVVDDHCAPKFATCTAKLICECVNQLPSITPTPTENMGTCIDSDGGLNYYVKGVVTHNGVEIPTDWCKNATTGIDNTIPVLAGRYLNEGICPDAYTFSTVNYECPNGCYDGACLSTLTQTPTPTRTPTITPIQGNTPTPTTPANISPTLTPTRTVTPTPNGCPICAKKGQGDADCNNVINEADYNIWKSYFLAGSGSSPVAVCPPADFNRDGKVDLQDFEIWRRNAFSSIIPDVTITKTPTPTGASSTTNTPIWTPTPTKTPMPTATRTPTPTFTKTPTPTRTPTPGSSYPYHWVDIYPIPNMKSCNTICQEQTPSSQCSNVCDSGYGMKTGLFNGLCNDSVDVNNCTSCAGAHMYCCCNSPGSIPTSTRTPTPSPNPCLGGGIYNGGGCWYMAGDINQNCTGVCLSKNHHCIQEDWLDNNCTILKQFYPSCACISEQSVSAPAYLGGPSLYCADRMNSAQSCNTSNSYEIRLCKCTTN